ncbi:MAG: hypothetical protein OSB38_23810 [Paraburkholderia fungorum]|nr:hypothetical protein [Paraburkholderia fungorum]
MFVALLRSIVVWMTMHVGLDAISPAPPHYDGMTVIGRFAFAFLITLPLIRHEMVDGGIQIDRNAAIEVALMACLT